MKKQFSLVVLFGLLASCSQTQVKSPARAIANEENESGLESIECISNKSIQAASPTLKTDAKITFNLEKNGTDSKIKNVKGHIHVQSAYSDGEVMNDDNTYKGEFSFVSLNANPNYKPRKYKGWAQFQNFDAEKTSGLEDGMWGNFVLELKEASTFEARYIFQAGDHMGGTVLFNCRVTR